MKTLKILIPTAVLLLLAGQAVAQSEEELERKEAEAAAAAEASRARVEAREAEVARELEEQERRMAEAARRIAELSQERLPQIREMARTFEFMGDGKPRLGVNIGESGDGGPVEGVIVTAVTPGSAAAEAGLRAGDIITALNGESLSAENSEAANHKVVDFMKGVEEGDVLEVEYLRDGKVGKVEAEPRPVDWHAYNFRIPAAPKVHMAPGEPGGHGDRWVFAWPGNVWADMELVELSEGLGSYFGTDKGVLVVSAPKSDALQLEDGDVILSIDGREPTSVRHALRILGSYQAGESLELEIMREKRKRKLEIEVPDNRSGMRWAPEVAPVPALAPRPAPAPGAGWAVEKT